MDIPKTFIPKDKNSCDAERLLEEPVVKPACNVVFSIDDILKGQSFCHNRLQAALQQDLDHSDSDGIVVTMPELIAAKVKADNSHDFWQNWYGVYTEENIGLDKKGVFYGKGEPVLVVVNGGGLLTPCRIKQARDEGLINGSANYSNGEFDNLLEGRLPNRDLIYLYRFEEIKKGVSNLPHRFGVVMPYKIAQETKSGFYKKKAFLRNPLVIARAGGPENLEAYYERAKDSDGDVGNHQTFKDRDASTPQGRGLLLSRDYYGLEGGSLNYNGRFIGVAP